MVESATEFRKNGFNDEDAAQLARVSSMFQNVADETISAGDSAQFLISQLIAFNQNTGDVASNAMHIADALNEVANSFAVGTGDLATGLKVVASSSSAMGNSLEQTIGLMTAITEQTKNASKASRGLNSIMANLAQVLDPASSNGEKIVQIFDDLGVSMYDANDQLKSGFDLLQGLYEKWGTLDGNTKKYIATTIAGTTQLNNFLALMNNFGHAIGATDTALESQGSAMRENAAYMESIQAKLSQLQSTFQDFANNIIGSDLAKGILDIANALLKVANTDFGQIVTQIVLLTSLGWGATSLLKALKVFQAGVIQFKALAQLAGAAGAAGGVKSLADAFALLQLSSAAVLPIILAISAALVGLYAFSKTDWFQETFNGTEYVNEQIDTLNAKITETKDKIQELKDQGASQNVIDIYSDKLDTLNKQLDKLNQKKVDLAFGETVTDIKGVNEFGDVITTQVNAIENYITKLQRLKVDMENATSPEQFEALQEQYIETSEALEHYYEVGHEATQGGIELTESQKDLWYQLVDLYGTTEEVAAKQVDLTLAQSNTADSAVKAANGLITEADQLGITKDKMLDLISQNIIFNNTSLDVSQKIQALGQLAAAAGVAKDMIASVNDNDYKWAKHYGVSAEDYMSHLWSRWMGSLPKTATTSETGTGTGTKKGTGTGSGKTTSNKSTKDIQLESLKDRVSVLKSELSLMQERGDSEDKQIAKMREIQAALHNEAEYMRKIGSNQADINALSEEHWKITNDINKLLDEQNQKAEEARKAALEQQKSDYETAASYVQKKIEEEIQALQDQKTEIEQFYDNQIQALQNTNDELEQQIKYEEILNNLAKSKDKQLYVFSNGQFQYMQDTDEIAAAQAELDTYQRDKALQEEIDKLNELKDNAVATIDAQIEYWEKYKDEWSNVVDQYTEEQNRLVAEQVLGIDLEQKNWEKRLMNAQAFADKYNNIMASLKDGTKKTQQEEEAPKDGKGYYFDYSKVVGNGGWTEAEMKEGFNAPGKSTTSSSAKTAAVSAGVSAGINAIVKALSGKKHASGTLGSTGGLSLVGEQGPELRVLGQGDGIIPADVTRNLWNWGKINPGAVASGSNNIFNIANLSLPNARDAESLVDGLKQLAYQRAYKRA